MPLRGMLTSTWDHIQGFLFPMLREKVVPLTAQHERLVVVLGMARIEAFVRMWPSLPGRPQDDRHALARAFVAKAVLNLATTSGLIERLAVDATLRRLCGWERASAVPSESTFSRAFAKFAASGLPGRVHEALIVRTHKDRLVGHISRDATAIEAREKPAEPAQPAPKIPKRKRGRPKKGEVVSKKEPRRLERQAGMTLAEIVAEVQHAGHVRGADVELRAVPRTHRCAPTALRRRQEMQRGGEALVRGQAAWRGEHLATPHLVTTDAAQQHRRVVAGLSGLHRLAEGLDAGDDGLHRRAQPDELDRVTDPHLASLDRAGDDGAAAGDGQGVLHGHQDGASTYRSGTGR